MQRRQCSSDRRGLAVWLTLLVGVMGNGACTRAAPPSDGAAPRVRVDDDRSPCARLCDRLGACEVPAFIGAAACTRDCEDDARQREGPCRAPRLAYEACVEALACPDVRAVHGLGGDQPGPCAPERHAVIACEPSEPTPFIYFQF